MKPGRFAPSCDCFISSGRRSTNSFNRRRCAGAPTAVHRKAAACRTGVPSAPDLPGVHAGVARSRKIDPIDMTMTPRTSHGGGAASMSTSRARAAGLAILISVVSPAAGLRVPVPTNAPVGGSGGSKLAARQLLPPYTGASTQFNQRPIAFVGDMHQSDQLVALPASETATTGDPVSSSSSRTTAAAAGAGITSPPIDLTFSTNPFRFFGGGGARK